MNIKKMLLAATAVLALSGAVPAMAADAPAASAVLKNYGDIAQAKYEDALTGSR